MAEEKNKTIEEVAKPKFRYYHPECSNTAFLMYEQPEKDKSLNASNIVYPDGRKPKANDEIVCFSCRAYLTYLHTENVLNV